jgi:hypothetical protein
MPRPRTPLHLARITGADKVHPARFAGRSDPKTIPLGGPSDWMSKDQRAAWALFRAEIPWLMESDRCLVEIAASIRARLLAGEQVGVSALNQLRMCAAQMGATPADRSRIALPNDPKPGPDEWHFT